MVTLIDLSGCGDSSGDFSDATWKIWREDAQNTFEWVNQLTSCPVIFWGLRTGALLAAEMASYYSQTEMLILWEPVISGEQFLNQFFRIELANNILSDATINNRDILLERLETAGSIEIGGYQLTQSMALELYQIHLTDFIPNCPITWFELGIEDSDKLKLTSRAVITRWQISGISLTTKTIKGQPFWGSKEIITCSPLISETTKALLL